MYYPNGLGPLLKIGLKRGLVGQSEEESVPLWRLSNLSRRWPHGQDMSYFYLSNTFFIEHVAKVSNPVVIQVHYGSPMEVFLYHLSLNMNF